MTTGPRSQYDTCVRWRSPFDRTGDDFGKTGSCCAAVPEGVPRRVFSNGLDHRQPIDGNHGVRWESNCDNFPEWAFLPQFLGVGGTL
jgi:hypothetical protein